MNSHVLILGLPLWLSCEKSACNAGDTGYSGSIPWIGKIPWRRKWQPTSVFLPGGSHGQRSMEGYSPWYMDSLWESWTGLKHLSMFTDVITEFRCYQPDLFIIKFPLIFFSPKAFVARAVLGSWQNLEEGTEISHLHPDPSLLAITHLVKEVASSEQQPTSEWYVCYYWWAYVHTS